MTTGKKQDNYKMVNEFKLWLSQKRQPKFFNDIFVSS